MTSLDSIYIHDTAVVDSPCSIGKNTRIWHFCHLMEGCRIGENCTIGQGGYIASTVVLGNNVKVQNNVSLYDGVTIADDVFIGPSAVFTNIKNPRAFRNQRTNYRSTKVKNGATIGANVTIVCGVTIGAYAFIGAGAVVTHDIPDHARVWGVPATQQGWVCKCGLDATPSECLDCGWKPPKPSI